MFKSHKGVQGEFARLVKDEPNFGVDLRAFLGRAYNLKAIADYEAGAGTEVTQAQALEAITDARRFVTVVEGLIR